MDTPINPWLYTPTGEARGYIQPHGIEELWFHTGTACNLACPFCLEGSKPGDTRLDRITVDDVKPLMAEAVELGVRQFSFTGGEPFILKDFINILRHGSNLRPCLVLTNGTDPVLKRLHQIAPLLTQPNPVSFRVSIDYPERSRHDLGRGLGSFDLALEGMRRLHELGFKVSLARQMDKDEDAAAVEQSFRGLLRDSGLPQDMNIVAFPDFLTPGALPKVPYVTEQCMTTYQTEETRRAFMCAFSKMVIKKHGRMRIYSCTLVDDDLDYDQGETLAGSLQERVMLKHHRCYSCFAFGSSCSEM